MIAGAVTSAVRDSSPLMLQSYSKFFESCAQILTKVQLKPPGACKRSFWCPFPLRSRNYLFELVACEEETLHKHVEALASDYFPSGEPVDHFTKICPKVDGDPSASVLEHDTL